MTTTRNKIEQALSIMSSQDWYWCMSDSNSAYGYARGSMRTFVELVATIEDSIIVKALRDLWTAKYEYIKATMFGGNDEAKVEFKTKEAELMSIINPAYQMAVCD